MSGRPGRVAPFFYVLMKYPEALDVGSLKQIPKQQTGRKEEGNRNMIDTEELEKKIISETGKELTDKEPEDNKEPLDKEPADKNKAKKSNHYDGTEHIRPYSFDRRTAEEKHVIAVKGGKASQAVQKKKRSMQEIARWLLEKDLPDDMIADSLGDTAVLKSEDGSIDKSGAAVILARMIQEAMNGNTKAVELVRDTSGQKPTDKVQVEAVTEADRSLMEKISRRLDNKTTDTTNNP